MLDSSLFEREDFISPPGSDLPFKVGSFESMPQSAQSGIPHRHSFYEVLFLEGGSGHHIIDFVPHEIAAPCVFFVSPGQVHFWELESPLQGWILLFTDEFLLYPPSDRGFIHELSFFHMLDGTPRISLDPSQRRETNRIVESIRLDYEHDHFGRSSMIRALLHVLLVTLERLREKDIPGEKRQHTPPIVRRFKQLVAQNFPTDRAIGTYANRLAISEAHLHDTVRRWTGKTPGSIIRAEVTMEARRLLAHTDLTVAEIGHHLSFDDPSYFSRFILRETGENPSSFRERIRGRFGPIVIQGSTVS